MFLLLILVAALVAVPPNDVEPAVYTTNEVCAVLRVDRKTLRRLMAGGLPVAAYKVGGRWRYNRSDVDALVACNPEVAP